MLKVPELSEDLFKEYTKLCLFTLQNKSNFSFHNSTYFKLINQNSLLEY